MTYCCYCGHHVEPSSDARIGWVHACRHRHLHLIAWVIGERQRSERFSGARDEEPVGA